MKLRNVVITEISNNKSYYTADILGENKTTEDSNANKQEEIAKQRSKIFIIKDKIGELMDEYNKSENREVLKTAMQLQQDELMPAIENQRRLIAEHMEMISDSGSHYLFKNEVALMKNNILMGEPPRVIHFIRSSR